MAADESSIISWVLAGVSTVVAAITSGFAYLGRRLLDKYVDDIAELKQLTSTLLSRSEKCEQEHTATKIELAKLGQKIELMQCQLPEKK